MNTNLKKALVVFGGGFLLFLAFKRLKPFGGRTKKSKSSSGGKSISDEQRKNAAIIVKAYADAMKAGENKAFLDEMNAEFVKTYKMRVVPNKATGSLMATDLDGNKIS